MLLKSTANIHYLDLLQMNIPIWKIGGFPNWHSVNCQKLQRKMHQPSKNKTHAFLPATQFIWGLQLHMKKANYCLPGGGKPPHKTKPQPCWFSFKRLLFSEPYEDRLLSKVNAKGVNKCQAVTPVAEILLKSSSGLQYLWRPDSS